MSETVTVKTVLGNNTWTGQRGPMMTWKVILEDGRTVERNMMPETPGPKEGDVWEVENFEVTDDRFPPKARGVKMLGNSSNGSQPAQQTLSQPPRGSSPPTTSDLLVARQNANRAASDILGWAVQSALALRNEENKPFAQLVEEHIDRYLMRHLDLGDLVWERVTGPAKREEVPPDIPKESPPSSRSAGSSTGEGQLRTERQPDGSVPTPEARPTDGGVASAASPSTLARLLKAKRTQGVSEQEFSHLLTSKRVESVNHLTEEQALSILAWMDEGEAQAA